MGGDLAYFVRWGEDDVGGAWELCPFGERKILSIGAWRFEYIGVLCLVWVVYKVLNWSQLSGDMAN
jgi:hypothetical protein